MSKNKNGLPDGVSADSPNPGESRSNDSGIITESAGGVKQAPPADVPPDDLADLSAWLEQVAQELSLFTDPLRQMAENLATAQVSLQELPPEAQAEAKAWLRTAAGRAVEIFSRLSTPEGLIAFLKDLKDLKDLPRAKSARPADALLMGPITDAMRWPTDTHLNSMVMEVVRAEFPDWTPKPEIFGYALERKHGTAIVEKVNEDGMKRIAALFGPAGIQVIFGVLESIEKEVRRRNSGKLVPFEELTSYRITCADVLRSLKVKPEGNGYKLRQQMQVREVLDAAARVKFLDVRRTGKRAKISIGSLINIEDTERETELPFDPTEVSPKPELLSVTVRPGKNAWELRRKGFNWCHSSLMDYNAKRQSPEILLTFYAGQLAVNSQNNRPHRGFYRLGTLMTYSGIKDSNKTRRLDRLHEALNQLAANGAIPATRDPATGQFMPIIERPTGMAGADTENAELACMIKLFDRSQAFENGYKPLARTSNPPSPMVGIP